jgi:TolB-like protein
MTDTITAARNMQAPHPIRTCVSERRALGTREALSFRFARFEIDVARQELRRAGAVVHIEPQVFDLLVFLVQHRNRIVSKDELIEAIWQGRVISEATLTSRIRAARRALGDSGNDQSLIRTLRKRGFRFVGEIIETHPAPAAIAESQPAGRQPAVNNNEVPKLVPNAEPLPLSEKASIAVLPFQNMSQDPDQEYFADGLTEDIITGLSRQRWFSVIARNSSSTYKGHAVDVREAAVRLGVRYVLEGSVRMAANRVRVTGQLIDAAKGNHLWAEKYDRELADIFVLQDDIATRVIGSVGPQILVTEAARVQSKRPRIIDAHDLVMQAVPHMWRLNGREQARAREQLQHAITLDPDYAHAHALLGWVYLTMCDLDTCGPISEFTNKALAAGMRATTLDNEDSWSQLVAGVGHARRGRSNLALAHLTKSVQLSPGFALGYAGVGYALAVGGQPERALQSLEQAHQLSRRDPFLANYAPVVRYTALFALKRYDETIAVCRAAAALHPNHAGAWRFLTASLGLIGRIEEAREALAHALTLQADLPNDEVYADPHDRVRILEGLRKAGLKGC